MYMDVQNIIIHNKPPTQTYPLVIVRAFNPSTQKAGGGGGSL